MPGLFPDSSQRIEDRVAGALQLLPLALVTEVGQARPGEGCCPNAAVAIYSHKSLIG